jgi:hypothetical protein
MHAAAPAGFATPALAAALLDPAAPAPPRFDVHRNTVMSSLVRALAEGFPSIERLVGTAFFAAMAAEFVRQHPPSHPVLLAYGAGFAAFLERFAPVAHLPYLADVARLDGLRRRAWHAADVTALGVASLAGIRPEDLAERRITVHPSVGVLGSLHPALSIWAAQNGDESDDARTAAAIAWHPETAIVWRADEVIRVEAVDTGVLSLLAQARRAPLLKDLLSAESEALAHGRATAFATALRDGLLVDDDALARALAAVPDAALFDDFLPFFPHESHHEITP